MERKARTVKIGRDAKTGRIVSPGYAKKHPNTTTVETRRAKK